MEGTDLEEGPVPRGDEGEASEAGETGLPPDREAAEAEEGEGASPSDGRLSTWLVRLTRAPVLFPLIAVVTLAALWAVTLNLVRVERENARASAAASAEEHLGTYEAQVVRVLRQIDRTLKSLQYAYRLRGEGDAALSDLSERGLLPPDLVFTVTVVDADGEVAASTRSSSLPDVAEGGDVVRTALGVDSLVVSRPAKTSSGEWRLRFARRVQAPDGSVAVAVVGVDASFFVSGYEASKLGDRGVLAVLGTDGVFRARRTGEQVSAGGRVAYDSVVRQQDAGEADAVLAENGWDGVRRYTASRQLYGFPLAVVVGLSEQEQLAAVEERTDRYLVRAAAGSVLLVLVIGVLGRMNWKLERVREREAEARVAHAKRVEHLAYHDSLTGLPNRSFLGKMLERLISQARRYERRLAVLFLDLDRFKQINDTLGHDAGDQLLRVVAGRLEDTLRESDLVARMGGDEFVMVLPEVEEEEDVAAVARKVLSALRRPFRILGQEFRVTGSIGISLYPRDGEDEQALMKNADIAMYRAKEAGENKFRFFSEEMSAASLERLSLESSLRRALKNEEFELHYQPRRDIRSERITGVEALLRWRHPEYGLVEPMEFLPVAEETGLVVPIGRWVLKTACRQNVAWQEQGLPPVNVAVNLSARQFFDEGLVDDVTAALTESGMSPELLELEVCESVLARDARRTVPVLESLKTLGVKITIDNFGTGYSSLSVLRRFPLDTIKIDRLFLRKDAGESIDPEVTDAVLAMGRTLSSSVVAHGVETKEQADFLREQACDEVQGFYFNRPVSAADVGEVLRAGSAGEETSRQDGGATG